MWLLSIPLPALLDKAAAFVWLCSDYLIKIHMNSDKFLLRSVLGLQEKLDLGFHSDSAYWNMKLSHPHNLFFFFFFTKSFIRLFIFPELSQKKNLVLGSRESYNISIYFILVTQNTYDNGNLERQPLATHIPNYYSNLELDFGITFTSSLFPQ